MIKLRLILLSIFLNLSIGLMFVGCNKTVQQENITTTIEEITTIQSTSEYPTLDTKQAVTNSTSIIPTTTSQVTKTEIPTSSTIETTSIIEETTIPESESLIEPTESIELIFNHMWLVTDSNFRSGPGMEFEVYDTLSKGTELVTINFNWDNEWTQIIYNDRNGYVYTELLTEIYINKYDYYYILEGGQIEELDLALQEYAQDILKEWGCSDFYKLFLCQAYQESRYNMGTVSNAHDGYSDYGIMQIWEGHAFDFYSTVYPLIQAHPNYKTDPYDNIYIGLRIWYEWYKVTGDYVTALGCYLSGNDIPSQYYIDCVLYHLNYLYKEE